LNQFPPEVPPLPKIPPEVTPDPRVLVSLSVRNGLVSIFR